MINIVGLSSCEAPRTARELCKYVRGLNRIFSNIPHLVEHIALLCELLETAYAMAGGSRKKESISKIPPSDPN